MKRRRWANLFWLCSFWILGGIQKSAQAQILTIADSETRESLPFIAYGAPDSRCQGRANEKAEINLSIYACDSIVVRMLGYQEKRFAKHQVKNGDTVFLSARLFAIEEVNIRARRTNPADDLERILKKIRRNPYKKPTQSFFFLETTAHGELLERVELISSDYFHQTIGLLPSERNLGHFFFNAGQPFFNLDIDLAIKNIAPLAPKSGTYLSHLLNEKNIQSGEYSISTLQSFNEGEERILTYQKQQKSPFVSGFVRYNSQSEQVFEHRVMYKNLPKNIFHSINKEHQIHADSLIIYHYFENNILSTTVFSVYWTLEKEWGTVKLKSRGFIEKIDLAHLYKKIAIPSIEYKSIQEELSFIPHTINTRLDTIQSPMLRAFDFAGLPDSFVTHNDSLAYLILSRPNAMGLARQAWSPRQRLSMSDFRTSGMSSASASTYLSDLHRPIAHWFFHPNYEQGKLKFHTVPSFWNKQESLIIYHSPMQAMLIANLSFDIFEIFRQETCALLEGVQDTADAFRIIKSQYKNAQNKIARMNLESDYGLNLKKIDPHNRFVLEKTGIDNIKKLLTSSQSIDQNPIYLFSEADALFLSKNYDEALRLYLEDLKSKTTTTESRAHICFNLAQLFYLKKDKSLACEYYQKAIDLKPALSLERLAFRCD